MGQLERTISSTARHTRGSSPDAASSIRRITALADLLDSRFQIPGLKIRFGLDALVGLLPVVGDTVTAVVGGYIVAEAVRLGARRRVLIRMLANVLVDWLVGLVPLLDLVFDVAFKSNNRNARLLIREHEAGRLKEPRSKKK